MMTGGVGAVGYEGPVEEYWEYPLRFAKILSSAAPTTSTPPFLTKR